MLKRIVPMHRILRQALWGLIAFIALSVLAGAMEHWGGDGGRDRSQKEVAQIAWQFGLRSPEVDSALQRVGVGLYKPEVVALLDPATGKAAAAYPADVVGKSPEEMTTVSGVKLPNLHVLLNHRHLSLRRPDKNQSSGLSRGHRDRVLVMISPLSPWEQEHEGAARGHRIVTPIAATTPDTQEATPQGNWEGYGKGRHHEDLPVEPPLAYLLVVRGTSALSVFNIAIRLIAAIGAFGFLVYWLSIAWWTFKDACDRSHRAFAWGLLVLFTNLVGVAVYLIARKEWMECPSCSQGIERRFTFCSSCGHALKATCTKCGQPLQQDWVYCADCGTSRAAADKTE